MQLHHTKPPKTLEAVTSFSHTSFAPGGSAPQTALALSSLSISVAVLTHIGKDPHGETLRNLLNRAGVDTSTLIETNNHTSLAVLPLLTDGRRGCFVSLGCNLSATPEAILPKAIIDRCITAQLRVFHFGYPHLMPHLQGNSLRSLLETVKREAPSVLLSIDVNGADRKETPECQVLLPALEMVAAIHANLEEACVITGLESPESASRLSADKIKPIVEWFTDNGAGIALVTCGKDGVFAATSKHPSRVSLSKQLEADVFVHRAAFAVSESVEINASGAGDAFTAGVLAELAQSLGGNGLVRLADCGLASALHRIDGTLVGNRTDPAELWKAVQARLRVPPRMTLKEKAYSIQ